MIKLQDILVLLSEKNIEVIDSILKHSRYSYKITKNLEEKSNILITDDAYLNKELIEKLNNFIKVVCIIPSNYLQFIKKEFILEKKIIFVELPVTYLKLTNAIK